MARVNPSFSNAHMGGRPFSDASATGGKGGTSESGGELPLPAEQILQEVADMDKRRKFRTVFDSLMIFPKVRLPYSEYENLCNNLGLSAEEADELIKALHTAGLVMHFNKNVPIIVKPETVTRAFLDAVDLNNELNRVWLKKRHEELRQLLEDIEPLEAKLQVIQGQAERYARNCWRAFFVYVIGHCMVVPYLTFWRLSWDIMEPVTYMFNLWTLFLATWFYRKTNFEFTYESINEAIIRLRRERYFRRQNFDIDRYEALRDRIAEIEDDLLNPEWESLKQVHPDLPDAVKLVHLNPLELLKQYRADEKKQPESAA